MYIHVHTCMLQAEHEREQNSDADNSDVASSSEDSSDDEASEAGDDGETSETGDDDEASEGCEGEGGTDRCGTDDSDPGSLSGHQPKTADKKVHVRSLL